MDLKWVIAAAVVMIAAFIYVRAMRVHAGATWSEVVFPWRQNRPTGIASDKAKPAGPATSH